MAEAHPMAAKALVIREADEGEKLAEPVSGGGTPPRKASASAA
jgi:hypothetical protein